MYSVILTITNYYLTGMFLTSLVPLNLIKKHDSSLVCWKNSRPSSTRLCRPIKFEFVKETAIVINEEVKRVEDEIANLVNTVVEVHNKIFSISHTLLLTMIDGKIASTLTQTSSMAVCFICNAKPTEMNDLEILKTKTESEDALKFGISPLHARIKFMECILHIAYRKHFKAWRTNANSRTAMEEEKRNIQRNLKAVLGINVDVVKQGVGSTNDGNTSRRFFENPRITAEIVGVDENLIHRFKIILATINCNEPIDSKKFHDYCMDTAQLYISLYSWYYMPISVHKVLVHGCKIIAAAILPIGMLSEEAQEARNKDYKKYRLHHARKCDRVSTNVDVMNHLLASSDPYINKLRSKPKKKYLEMHEDVKNLLCD